MSTVAYKHGVLAADTRACGGRWQASPGHKNKIHRLPDGRRVGIVSAILGEPERFLDWLAMNGDPYAWQGNPPDMRALVIYPDGRVYLFDNSPHAAGPIEADCYAIGSGADFALGAMFAGKTAQEAVRIACQLDRQSGGPILVMEPQ